MAPSLVLIGLYKRSLRLDLWTGETLRIAPKFLRKELGVLRLHSPNQLLPNFASVLCIQPRHRRHSHVLRERAA